MILNPFQNILSQFRKYALSERDKGDKFERLMQAYLQTDPRYPDLFTNVWLWNDLLLLHQTLECELACTQRRKEKRGCLISKVRKI